ILHSFSIRGEIQIHREGVGQRNNGHHIGGRHLLVHVLQRRFGRACHFFRLHRGQIKEEEDQPPIFEIAFCNLPNLRRGHAAGSTQRDRKSTRLNSSHLVISYAVFCLKKKKKNKRQRINSK